MVKEQEGGFQLLPPLSTTEFETLRADIKANGVRHPVIVDEDGNVLDGNHRLRIDANAPRRVVKGLSPGEKEAFVFRANLCRRNMSADQKRDAQKRMRQVAEKLRTEDARKWTQKRVAEVLGVSQQVVSLWFDDSRTNTSTGKGSKPLPDARIKIPRQEDEAIAARVKAGEPQAQVAADYGVSQRAISKRVAQEEKRAVKEAKKKKQVKRGQAFKGDGFHHGDFRKVAETIPDGSVSLIFTDPPYGRKSLPLYGDLAALASKKLIDGGSLVTYLGQYQIGEVISLVAPHLRLWWTLAVIHTGKSARMREYGVVVKWKPMLWFVNGTRADKETFVDDAVVSEEEKGSHDWQQSLKEAAYYIEKITPTGGLVWDPFCGGGTTAVACNSLGVRFITCDIDNDALCVAKGRLA